MEVFGGRNRSSVVLTAREIRGFVNTPSGSESEQGKDNNYIMWKKLYKAYCDVMAEVHHPVVETVDEKQKR